MFLFSFLLVWFGVFLLLLLFCFVLFLFCCCCFFCLFFFVVFFFGGGGCLLLLVSAFALCHCCSFVVVLQLVFMSRFKITLDIGKTRNSTHFAFAVSTEMPKPDTMSYEDVLVKYVLSAYRSRSKYGRPVMNYNDTLTVEFAIQLTQIVDLDEQEQVLTLNVWDQYVSTGDSAVTEMVLG